MMWYMTFDRANIVRNVLPINPSVGGYDIFNCFFDEKMVNVTTVREWTKNIRLFGLFNDCVKLSGQMVKVWSIGFTNFSRLNVKTIDWIYDLISTW